MEAHLRRRAPRDARPPGCATLTHAVRRVLPVALALVMAILCITIIGIPVAVLLLLVMFILIEVRMNRMMARLEEISESASQFVKLGMALTKK